MAARPPANTDIFNRGTDLLAKPVFHVIRHPTTGQIVEPNRAHGGIPVAAGFIDDSTRDAFGRWRVSQPYQLFDSISQYDSRQWRDFTATGGAIAREAANPTFLMTTTGTVGSRAVTQTRAYMSYVPGKSQLIIMTGILGEPETGVAKRVGYFDDDNGLFFEMISTGAQLVVRSKVSGSVVNTTIKQNDWNIDKMDGRGTSGILVDFTKTHIFEIDFQWLGVGRVRFALNINGVHTPIHEFVHANYLTDVYMVTPHLPVRYEIVTLTGGGAGGTLKRICASVVSEGGNVPAGSSNQISMGASLNAVTTREAILAVRPKLTFNGFTNNRKMYITHVEVYSSAQSVFWELIHIEDTTTQTGVWSSVSDISSAEYSLNPGFTGGNPEYIFTGYVNASAIGLNNNPNVGKIDIAFNRIVNNLCVRNPFTDIPNIVILYATSVPGSTTNVGATIRWESYD